MPRTTVKQASRGDIPNEKGAAMRHDCKLGIVAGKTAAGDHTVVEDKFPNQSVVPRVPQQNTLQGACS